MNWQTKQLVSGLMLCVLLATHAFASETDESAIRALQGRTEIQSKLADAFAWVFRDSKLTITEVHSRFLDRATAIVHVRWTMDGAKAPPGAPAPPREGIQLQVLRKANGQWLIASFQNTNGIPETPFPKGPVLSSNTR